MTAVDLQDLDILGKHYGKNVGGTAPEPATLVLLAIGSPAVLDRRKRR